MWEFIINIFATLFVAVGPIDNAAIFAGLTREHTREERRKVALKATAIAGTVLIIFPFVGNQLMRYLHIELYSLQVGGGILLFLVAIKMVMSEFETGESMSKRHTHQDYSVFPLAIPLIAGPATIIQSTLLVTQSSGDYLKQGIVFAVIIFLMIFSFAAFMGAGFIVRFLGVKGAETLCRSLGIVLAAMSAQLVIRGLAASGLFNTIAAIAQ